MYCYNIRETVHKDGVTYHLCDLQANTTPARLTNITGADVTGGKNILDTDMLLPNSTLLVLDTGKVYILNDSNSFVSFG